MNVTALLNESSSAVDQQNKGIETLRLPTRNRTPWDAGGYSLPLNTAAMKITSPEVDRHDPFTEDDTTTVIPFTSAMPTSSIHKFTDSRSSLSSFASSSLHSANHSRYSSISTLNSPRALAGNVLDPLLSPNPPLQSIESSYFKSRDEEEMRARFHQDHSPTKSLDTLAQIAEDYQAGESASPRVTTSEGGDERRMQGRPFEETRISRFTPRHSRSISSGGSASSNTPNAEVWTYIEGGAQEIRDSKMNSMDVVGRPHINVIDRPNSPSDTLLIKRTIVPTLHLNTKDQLQIPYLPDQHHPTKFHKRAVSAPNFDAMGISRMHQAPMAHEPTPPASNHPDQASPPAPFEQSLPGSPPTASIEAPITEPVCMYIDDCDTDSPQRKAISHIFGRNKMCTRMIPEHLWVHLCRKHYQRCRYRDQDKWAKAQCDLVQIQIRRIHEWSMTNQINGSGIRLQNWTLTMRKREKMRRMKLAQESGAIKRKRGASGQDDDDVAEREESGYPSTTTKVPDWLVDHCDKEFSTAGILVVFNRLHQDIIDGRVGPHFPDLELLPNLLTPEGNEKKASKPAARATPRKTHQRSQSLQTPATRESQFRDSATKRRRPNEELSFERGLQPAMRQPLHQPTYAIIMENEVSEATMPRPFYHDSLLAPTAQRMSGQSMAAHLETGSSVSDRHMHSRSHSEASTYSNSNMYSSPEYQMGSHWGGATSGRFEMGQHGHTARVAPSPEYTHASQMGGRDYVIDERNTSLGQRRHRMEEFSHGTGSQGMMGPRRQGPRQYSMGPEEHGTVHRHSPMIMGQHEKMMMGHNRHNSSPAQRSQYISPQQHHSLSPYNSPHIRENQEMREFYGSRR